MQGDYFKVVKNYNKKTAYLVFSAMSVPTGTFQMGKALANLPGLFNFINDKDNNWYQYGLPGIGNNTEDSVAILKESFKKEQIEKVICIGASMGGYGAALYGELLNADLVICFSSEVRLGIPFSRSSLHSEVDTTIKHHDLVNVIGKNEKTRFVFFVGTSDIIDLYNASLISSKGFGLYLLKNRNHFLTQDLHAEFTLERIIKDIIREKGFINHSWIENKLDLKNDADEIESLYNIYVALRKREYDKCEGLLAKIQKLKNFELYQLFSGMYFSRLKEYEKAEQMLTLSLNQNNLNRDTLFELAIVKRALGKTDESIELYKFVLDIDPSYAPALNHLGMIHEKLGSLNNAEDYFRKALILKNEDSYRKNLIGLLEKNIKDKQLQIEKLLANPQ